MIDQKETAKFSLHIDWLSITIPISRDFNVPEIGDTSWWQKHLAARATLDESAWRSAPPLFGYSYARQSACGTIMMWGRASMGLHVIYSSQALQALNAQNRAIEDIISRAIKNGARATRIDIALDIRGGGLAVADFQRELEQHRVKTASRTWRSLTSSDGGATLYIGARSSERMLRIYDKKAERASVFEDVGENNWIRVEIELKGDRAMAFLKACRDNKLNEIMLAHITDTVDFPSLPEWGEAVKSDNASFKPEPTKRKDTKTRHWLMATIAPIVAREAATDLDFWVKFQVEVRALMNALLDNIDPNMTLDE